MNPTTQCYTLTSIGIIKTPYKDKAPYQPIDSDTQEFSIEVHKEYQEGLKELASFTYMYVLYYADRVSSQTNMTITPPWAPDRTIGLFASRSPARPNPIGLSVVHIKHITNNIIYTSGLDVFDKTPLIDIKPYILDLDTKRDANYGWVHQTDNQEHLALHIQGIPHEH